MLFGLVGIAVMLLLSAGLSKLIEAGKLTLELTPVLGYGILGGSALTGCLLTALNAKSCLLPLTALTGGIYLLCLCIFNGFLQRGEFQRFAPPAGIVLAAVLLSTVIAATRGKGRAY